MQRKIRIIFSGLSIALFLILGLMGVSQAKDFNDSEAIHIKYPGWFNESPFNDLSEDLQNALSDRKSGLMVLFTTQGCSYCSAFIERSLGDSKIAKVVQDNFNSVGMEIFDDVDMVNPSGQPMSIKHFAKVEGAEYSPTLIFYGKDGQRILRAVGYQSPKRFQVILNYVIGKHYTTTSFRDYFQSLAKNETPSSTYTSLKNDRLFINPPYALDRSRFAASQPLLVIFEKTGCAECADFHKDVLALDEVRELAKKFEVVRLDVDDNQTPVLSPSGKRVTPASWYQEANFTRVPALMFFDEKGNNVLETDALVRRQRMLNSVNFVLERAYEKDWTYQRFARSKGIERSLRKQKQKQNQ